MYWQVFFGVHPLKWDNTDIALPWRYFVSECLNNNILPLWNPFVNAGLPQCGDNNTWYPIVWIISYLTGYNLLTLHAEFMFHIILGALGFFILTRLLNLHKIACFISALYYGCCGFVVSNAQHLGWIIGYAWLPLIIWAALKLFSAPNLLNSATFSIILCFFLGSYPGVFVPGIYCLALIFVYLHFKYAFVYAGYKNYLIAYLLVFIFIMLSSSATLLGMLQLSSSISRSVGLSFTDIGSGVNFGSLSLNSLISLAFPYPTTINNNEVWLSDFSLINSYIGLLTLVVLFLGVYFKHNHKKKIVLLLAIALLCWAITLPQYFPFRKYLYWYVPLMNQFRFPAIYRLFGIFFALLASAYSWNFLLKEAYFNYKNKIIYCLLSVIVALLSGLAMLMCAYNILFWKFKKIPELGWNKVNSLLSISEKLFFQVMIGIAIISAFLIIIRVVKNQSLRMFSMLVLVVFEVFTVVQLNIKSTVVEESRNAKIENKIFYSQYPKGFPIPDNSKPLNYFKEGEWGKHFLNRNYQIFYKQPTFDGYTPYQLINSDLARKEHCYEESAIFPLLFASKQVDNNKLTINNFDTLSTQSIVIQHFNPNSIRASVQSADSVIFTYLQNYYQGWQAFVDDKPQSIIISNQTFMSVKVPSGKHTISFLFKPTLLIACAYISIISFIGLLITLFVSTVYNSKK